MHRRGPIVRRCAWALGLTVTVLCLAASPAAADPANPTNYRSRVTAMTPTTADLAVDIVGGDSFVRLRTNNADVVVLGYEGEPYLHFTADGNVRENARSPAVVLNQSRYGTTVDERADAKAAPEWRRVAGDGTFIWHDHRIHWMAKTVPSQLDGGAGKVLDWHIPLLVNGDSVHVRGELFRTEPPSVVPYLVAGITAAVVAAVVMRRFRASTAAVLFAVAFAAVVVSSIDQLSIPAAAGRRVSHIVIPALAAAGAIVALGWRRTLYGFALKAAAALILPLWVFLNADALTHAHLPGDVAPILLRGAVTAAAAVVVAFAVIDLPHELRAASLHNAALRAACGDDARDDDR